MMLEADAAGCGNISIFYEQTDQLRRCNRNKLSNKIKITCAFVRSLGHTCYFNVRCSVRRTKLLIRSACLSETALNTNSDFTQKPSRNLCYATASMYSSGSN